MDEHGVDGPAAAHRRWLWALSAAAVGAAVGAGVVLVRRLLLGEDAPDAQDPAELRAVVDLPPPAPTSGD